MTYIRREQSPDELLSYLKRLAPPSMVELGLSASRDGLVGDVSKSGATITGVVRDRSGTAFSPSITIISGNELSARCGCSSDDDMSEQWCPHAVALSWRAMELGFFAADSGFASAESMYRINTSSPDDIARVISEVSTVEAQPQGTAQEYTPDVSIRLDISGDRLGVKVLFDGESQVPGLFEGFRAQSSRALDNILLEILDDKGSWDEEQSLWYVNASEDIEIVLGILEEYKKVAVLDSQKKIAFAHAPLDARLVVQWTETGARLSCEWILPDGSFREPEGQLIGTGPYWAVIDNTIYKLVPAASKIATIFPYSDSLSFSRAQSAPILDSLRGDLYDRRRVNIVNPELQPAAEVRSPEPQLTLERREAQFDHFATQQKIEIEAALQFIYPQPPKDGNIVYLRSRDEERAFEDQLKSLGFEYLPDRKRYIIRDDAALDLVFEGTKTLGDQWSIVGLDSIQKATRFSELSINIQMSSAGNEDDAPRSKIDWFDCHISLTQNNANVPLSTIFKNSRSDDDRWVRLDSGAFARVPAGGIGMLKTTLGMVDPNFKLTNTIRTKLSTAQAISFSRIEDNQFAISLDKRLQNLSQRLKDFHSIDPVKPSKHFVGKLRTYQEEGLSWLNFLHEFECGGVLADEMGLGKTVQTLVFLQHIRDRAVAAGKTLKPALIVAPTSIITNWSYEARRFVPKMKVLVLHGPQRKKSFGEIKHNDIIITSYALLRLDRAELERAEFSHVVLDEAQNIKNPAAATTRAAKALRCERRLALSGTPTENRPLELWSIMDFLMPGYLGTYDFFRTHIEKPILEGGPGVHVARMLNAKTRPFLLRRTKNQVERDLPPKIESVLPVEMTDSQRALYNQIMEEVRPRVLEAVQQKGVRGASVSILAALLRLRQVCNHPNSISALRDLQGFDSGKFNLLKDLVEEALESGRKILLFCQFIEMLSLIRGWLETKKTSYLYLDGATKNRQDLVDQFNADPNVRIFLISLKAGGTGLNLTGADTVIIYDPWWNPAIENQAVDRAHRIGQNKTVNVYRLVTENSVEQKIMELKSKKAKIVDALINENGLSTLSLSKGDIESLFSPMVEPEKE